jgi:signal transduction histidine kinase
VRALSNLLFNASDAAGDGQVRLVGQCEAERVVITVADSGPGIAAEAMDKIFNPFFTTKDAGTGLGLAIVHRVIEAHGGQIAASNSAASDASPNGLGGALFTVTLPVER